MHDMLMCCFNERAWAGMPDDRKNEIMREYGTRRPLRTRMKGRAGE